MALVLTQTVFDGPIHIIDKTTGEHITIDLVTVNGGQAKYAITASDNIIIDRDVVHHRKLEEKIQ